MPKNHQPAHRKGPAVGEDFGYVFELWRSAATSGAREYPCRNGDFTSPKWGFHADWTRYGDLTVI